VFGSVARWPSPGFLASMGGCVGHDPGAAGTEFALDADDHDPSQPRSRHVSSEALKNDSTMKALREMQKQYPYLAIPTHDLHHLVRGCEDAAAAGEHVKAKDSLARLEQAIEQEERTLAASFKLFVPPGKDHMTPQEVKRMLGYLGFPAADTDVDQIMDAVDKDKDKTMSLSEFQQYVGRMGGSFSLFAVRRERMKAKHGSAGSGVADHAMLTEDLKAAGIMEQEQAYWSLVLPRANEEFAEARRLTSYQARAVRHIRQLAKNNHENALPTLQRKVQSMGFQDNDLWMTLAYIRELAPIIVHVNLSKMMPFMENDTHYRNQFETNTSGGLLKPQVREKWERDLFGGCYDGAPGKDRCKYGVLNAMNDFRGVVRCAQYGDSYIVLKDARLRCTFSPEDSANLKADRLAVLDYYGHVLNEYSNDELKETIQIAKSGEAAILGNSEKVGAMKYKETQIHGEVRFNAHIERLVAHTRHRGKDDEGRLKAICAKHGWQFTWMDEERKRMEKEDQAKLGEAAWKEKLKRVMDVGVPDVQGVPEGFCQKGCGRKVQPGRTINGNPFKTCCRGCALGFGHDLACGNVDPKLCQPGMCLNGCGRMVNPGRTRAGRPFMTCCRSCASGSHDASCGSAPTVSLCKFGCGRRVAEPSGGRRFDTCCAKCAKTKGQEHDDQTCTPPDV